MTIESSARDHAAAFHWWQGFDERPEALNELADLVALRAAVDDLIRECVKNARTIPEPVFTWSAIAGALGTTPQAAQQRYGRTRPQRPW